MVGKIIARRYVVQKEIGTGSMGTVFQGLDTQSNELVAIKQLRPELADTELVERFKREGEALRELDHPNIVKMLATIEEDDQYYLVMEYVSGGDLSSFMQRSGKLDHLRCVNMAIDLADALTRAHRLNIIHRDLKPANVLLAENETLRLTDFGIAHIGSKTRVTNTDDLIGTIAYMPPEAINNGVYAASGDIWALGVMLFEMLVGKPPFTGKTFVQVIDAITTDPVPDMEALCPDVPVALIDLVYRMLQKDPAARIRSIRQVGLELEDLLVGRDTDQARFATTVFSMVNPPRYRLPTQITPFVGREAELYELEKMVLDERFQLVTILAPGGMGKSRLALELASRFTEESYSVFSNGIFFTELAPLSSADDIPSAIATATGYQFKRTGTPKEQILNYLANKKALLILDNFEHLLDGVGLMSDIQQVAPGVTVLATSRERLNLAGEQLFTLGGMDFPDWETPEDALNYAAVKLFIQSAKRIRPGFELTDDDSVHLAQICRLVEGMPLAIVLAAAWIETLSLEEIVIELTEGLDFLETEFYDIPERQRSILTVFDYSWYRLNDKEREAFARIAVFQGGATRKAVQDVTHAKLRLLQGLVNKGLLWREPDSGRYFIHELARQYAELKLDEMDETEQIRQAHSVYYLNMLTQYKADLKGLNQLSALSDIEADFENVRSAWNWAAEKREFDLLDKATESLMLFCDFRERRVDGIAFLQKARTALAPHPGEEIRPIWWQIVARHENYLLATGQENDETLSAIKAMLSHAQAHQDHEGIMLALAAQARFDILHSTLEDAIATLKETLLVCQTVADPFYMARINHLLGYCYLSLGQREQAQVSSQESLALARQTGDKVLEAQVLNNLGAGAASSEEAERLVQQSNIIYREMGYRRGTGWTSLNLAQFALARGEVDEGRRLAEQAFAITADINDREPHGFALCTLGDVARMQGDYVGAWQLYERSEPLVMSNPTTIPNVYIGWAYADCGLGDYQTAKTHCYQALKRSFQIQVLPLIISCFPSAAIILSQQGNLQRATELLSLAYHRSEYSTGWLDKMALIDQLHQTLKSQLSVDDYHAAWERGKALEVDATVQELLAAFRTDDA